MASPLNNQMHKLPVFDGYEWQLPCFLQHVNIMAVMSILCSFCVLLVMSSKENESLRTHLQVVSVQMHGSLFADRGMQN